MTGPDFDERDQVQARVPPQSIEAEQAVLGGLLLASEAAYVQIADWLDESDFFRRDHQLIYRGIKELAESRPPRPIDAVTLGEWFDSQCLADQVAGGAYLIELATTTPSAANIVAYAEIVADKSKLRQLIDVGTGIANNGFQPDGRDTRDVLADAQRAVTELVGNPRVGGVKGMREVGSRWFDELQRRYANPEQAAGLLTPWAEFNRLTGGFKPGELAIIAGRPSMGKSAVALNVALPNAMRGKRVLFFNLEMTDMSIYNRCIASLQDVPLNWLRNPNDEPLLDKFGDEFDPWSRVTAGVSAMREAKLRIDDSPSLKREQVLARARREHMREPIDMIVVDHLHLQPLPGKTRETVEIGEITRDYKGLAKELNCAFVLLSQLNRSLEQRQDKRPKMADLRESGNIEQDADLIVFVYRDDYYAEQEERASAHPGMVELIIAKQREGETGKVWARNALQYGRVDDFDGPAPARTAASGKSGGFRRRGNPGADLAAGG